MTMMILSFDFVYRFGFCFAKGNYFNSENFTMAVRIADFLDEGNRPALCIFVCTGMRI